MWIYEIQPTLINFHPNKYSQELHYYPLAVKLDSCVGSYDTLNDFLIKFVFQTKQKILIYMFLIWLQE